MMKNISRNLIRRASLGVLAAALSFSGAAHGAQLSYRGMNLEAMGIYKGDGLPTDPGTSLYGLTFDTGFSQIPTGLPGNTLLFFGIEAADWSNGTYDANGHRVPNVTGISSNAEIARFLYVFPDALQPYNPHVRLISDLVVPIMANVHVNASSPGEPGGLGVGGASIGDISWAPVGFLFTGIGNSDIQFSTYLSALVDFPSGSYSNRDVFNIGSNEYSMTFLANPIITFPKLNNLYWDTEFQFTKVLRGNNNFLVGASPSLTAKITGANTSDYTNGSLLTINTDLLLPVTKNLAIGPSFSVLDQVSNDRWNGHAVENSGEFSMGAGFGFQYRFQKINFQVKYLRSFDVRNMPSYNTVWAQFSIPLL